MGMCCCKKMRSTKRGDSEEEKGKDGRLSDIFSGGRVGGVEDSSLRDTGKGKKGINGGR